jgi:low temperature requirement protein LtrA
MLNFAITEFSEVRTQKKGAGQALIVLLAVWWSWNYTTWTTNDRFRYSRGVHGVLHFSRSPHRRRVFKGA